MWSILKLGANSHTFLVLSKSVERLGSVCVCHYASRNRNNVFGGDYTFFMKDKKMGLQNDRAETVSNKEHVLKGLEIMRESVPQLKREVKEKLTFDTKIVPEHGDFEYFFQADDKESMKDWIVSTDADYHHGKSTAKFSISRSNKVVFHGVMRSDIPRDGKTKRLGYCNLRSPYNMKSFTREIPYDWSFFNHVMLRFRGDGRNYMINIHQDRFFDINWLDIFQFPLYTRGGPYWQFAKIPFSSFFLSTVGKLQDHQGMVDTKSVKCFSITAMDYYGPFQLEIDYIALYFDENHDSGHLYETYHTSMFEVE